MIGSVRDTDSTSLQIQAQVNALSVLSSTGGSLTADGTEQTIYIEDEPTGLSEPVACYIDLDNMAAGDTTVSRVYHRLTDGGSLKLWDYASYAGADGGLANGIKVIVIDFLPNRHGYQITLEQTGGVNRVYAWEHFTKAAA